MRIIKLFTFPLLMMSVGFVALVIGLVIMYEPWEVVRCQGNPMLAYISFAWCFFWAIVNEGTMSMHERRRVVHPEPPIGLPKNFFGGKEEMISIDMKLKLMEIAREAAWVPENKDESGHFDLDKWIKTYNTLRDAIDDKVKEEIS